MITHFPMKFGDYTLQKLIARGGMAEVYRATKAGIGGFEKPVAIKMILPHLAENEDFIAMLTDEARIIVSISHANIAQVYDFCFHRGRYFIAMEYVHGIDLSNFVKRLQNFGDQLAIPHAVYIMSCVCAGLHYAHTKVDKDGNPQNIVHRDVSPHNILISYAGEVKIIDFGVAKARTRDASTQANVIKGKLHYMAPEQAKGAEIDGRADIFAAGIVLYELLTGELPFDGKTEFEIYNSLINDEIKPPNEINREIPKELNQLVLKMLQRDREDRFSDGYKVKGELERILHQIAPGYTNTRLSRAIEQLIEREKTSQPLAKANDSQSTQKLDPPTSIMGRPGITPLQRGVVSDLTTDQDFPALQAARLESQKPFPPTTPPPHSVTPRTDPQLSADSRTTGSNGATPNRTPSMELAAISNNASASQPAFQSFQASQAIPHTTSSSHINSAFSQEEAALNFDASFPNSSVNPSPQPDFHFTNTQTDTGQVGIASMIAMVAVCFIGLLIVSATSVGIFFLLRPTQEDTLSQKWPPSSLPPKSYRPEAIEDIPSTMINMPASVKSTVEEAAPAVVLTLDSQPLGAEVSMNGNVVGRTPFVLFTEKSPEAKEFTLTMDQYEPSSLKITPDKDITKSIELTQKQKKTRRSTRPKTSQPKLDSGTGLIDPFAF